VAKTIALGTDLILIKRKTLYSMEDKQLDSLHQFLDLIQEQKLSEATNKSTDLTFNQYQHRALETAVYPGRDDVGGSMYLALGLCGEAGEVAEKIKKMYRDGIAPGTEKVWFSNLQKEVGDVLWYAAMLLHEFEIPFNEAARGNLEKLADRKNRNVLSGSGDNR
jgi:NTP pyrophosphatase (non-canonical NTP hydrolase)